MKRDHSLKPVTVSTRTLLNGDPIPFLDDHTVDMGSSFDLFHEASHHDSPLVDANQTAARNYLRDLMHKHGFKGIKTEWWHYTLNDEPYPDTYFDFVF
jgi:D-alanyl-D-alanine dipeptidase